MCTTNQRNGRYENGQHQRHCERRVSRQEASRTHKRDKQQHVVRIIRQPIMLQLRGDRTQNPLRPQQGPEGARAYRDKSRGETDTGAVAHLALKSRTSADESDEEDWGPEVGALVYIATKKVASTDTWISNSDSGPRSITLSTQR